MQSMTIEVPPQFDDLEAQASAALIDAQCYDVITTDKQYEESAMAVKQLSDQIKAIKDVFDPLAKSANDAHKQITQARKDMLAPLESMKEKIGQSSATYYRQKQFEAQERARIEQAKLDAEAKAKADAEAKARQDAADEAEAMGDSESAEVMRMEADTVYTPPVERVKAAVDAPKVQGVSTVTTYDFEITDPALLPREFLCPDEKAIRAWVKAKKDKAEIPGVRVFTKTTMRA